MQNENSRRVVARSYVVVEPVSATLVEAT